MTRDPGGIHFRGNSMIKAAVLLSSYNGERFIREQIDSILNQEEVETELIVRDDGSTDRTREILDAS